MSVRMYCGELHTGRVNRSDRPHALARGKVKCELVHIARGHGGVGQPDLLVKGHVELWTQTHGVEYDSVIRGQLGVTKVEDLQER